MSITRLSRERKRQPGKLLTPESVAAEIVKGLNVSPTDWVLKPSFGEGAFVVALPDALAVRDLNDLYRWPNTTAGRPPVQGAA